MWTRVADGAEVLEVLNSPLFRGYIMFMFVMFYKKLLVAEEDIFGESPAFVYLPPSEQSPTSPAAPVCPPTPAITSPTTLVWVGRCAGDLDRKDTCMNQRTLTKQGVLSA